MPPPPEPNSHYATCEKYATSQVIRKKASNTLANLSRSQCDHMLE